MTANYVAAAGGLVFFVLGALHLWLTSRDFREPKYFVPANRALLDDLKKTRINLRKDIKDFWVSYLGFHCSHSVGLMFYGLAVAYCALERPDIFAEAGVRVVVLLFGLSYVLMSRAFWFIIPLAGSLFGATLIAVGMAMLY